MVDGHAFVEPLEDSQDAWALLGRIRPDPPEDCAVDAFGTAVGQVWPRAVSAPHQALAYSPQTRTPRDVEEDHRVRSVEASIPAAVSVGEKVSVENPAIPAHGRSEPF